MQNLTRFLYSPVESTSVSLGLLALRVGTGLFMFFFHGLGKVLNYAERAQTFKDPLGVGSEISLLLAIFAEVVCALVIVLGLGTRLAAIPLVITMLVAAGIVHITDPWAKQEFALLYAIPFFGLLLTGAGKFSLDARLFGRAPAAPVPPTVH